VTQYIWWHSDSNLVIPLIRLESNYLERMDRVEKAYRASCVQANRSYIHYGFTDRCKHRKAKYDRFFIGDFLEGVKAFLHDYGSRGFFSTGKIRSAEDQDFARQIIEGLGVVVGEAPPEPASACKAMHRVIKREAPPVQDSASSDLLASRFSAMSLGSAGSAALPPPSSEINFAAADSVSPPLKRENSLPVKMPSYYKYLFYMRKKVSNKAFGINQSELKLDCNLPTYRDIEDTLALRLDYILFKMHNLMYPASKP
jgi:hypothetical protein